MEKNNSSEKENINVKLTENKLNKALMIFYGY